jgi:hypothetical protein
VTSRPARLARVQLAPGLRLTERRDGSLQVGLHADRRLVLPDEPAVRAVLTRLRHPVDPVALSGAERVVAERLGAAGLLEDAHDTARRTATRATAPVQVLADDATGALARRLLVGAGLAAARGPDDPALTLVVTGGAEPRRTDLDRLAQADRPYLLVTSVAGRVRVGPCVVPGLTACIRCVDEHLADRDPAHPRLVAEHLTADRADLPPPGDLALGLAWAVRDVVALVDGDRPTTWSATVDLTPAGPVTHEWRRHPRCGCAWGDLLAV